jgi:hypothetical protein
MILNNVTIRLLVSNYFIYKHKLLRTQPTLLSTVGVGLIILWLRRELTSEVNLAHSHYINSTEYKTAIDFIPKVFEYFQLSFVDLPDVRGSMHHSRVHKEIQQDTTMYQHFIIPYLYEAQHVSGDKPPIIRSLKLYCQPLVFYTWKIVAHVVGGRCHAHNYIIPYLFEAQHVSSDTPPTIRSLKLQWQPLFLYVEGCWTCSLWMLSGKYPPVHTI